MSMSNTWRRLLVFSAIALITAGSVFAQAQSGNLYGTVTDNDGAALPGSTVSIEIANGGGNSQMQITDSQGKFRFLGLSPGGYNLRASLDGFSTVEYPNIQINVGRSTDIQVQLSPAVEETITVTSESPLLDSRKISTGSTVGQVELEKIPSARDPWAVLQTVPGVQTDRVNVGGNESGQQSQYTGPGSTGSDAVWAVDGVVITDMSAIGSSPSYYNFDAFEEMQATTGGSDASLATGGVTLNMVTRRGTNEWRGSGRFITADEGLQSSLDISPGEFGQDFDGTGPTTTQAAFKQGNRITSVDDFGVELGGPIVRDKLWIWANYGRNEVDLLTVSDFPDFTKLEDYGAKINAQLTTSNSLVAFYNYGDKIKIGRNASPTRPPATTWNQTGPTDIWKLEDTHVFSSSFFLTGMVSYVGGGFQLTPQGGVDSGIQATWDTSFVWQNNFIHHDTERPQDQFKLDGNYFFNSGNVSHDLKFGVGFRHVELRSQSLFAGNGIRRDAFLSFGFAYPVFTAQRPTNNDAETEYTALYAQDTLTFGNVTLNVGLRYDEQDGQLFSVSVPGVPGFEADGAGNPILPAATAPAAHQGFTWEDIVPRLGLTYALGEERKTLLRASYARFAEQLSSGFATLNAPASGSSYAYYYYQDTNGDGNVSTDEILNLEAGPIFPLTFDPLLQSSVNQVDPGLEASLTDELILSVEHALLPEFVIGATLTLRNIHNIVESETLITDPITGQVRPHQRGDYVLNQTAMITRPDGSVFTVPVFSIPGSIGTGGGSVSNGDREQDYEGLSLTFNKRLSNRWMMRGNFTIQNWEWDIPESERENPNIGLGGGNDDGGPVLQGSGTGSGSKGGVYINADWSYSITGMYQFAPDRKWGFNVSAALNGRAGYPIPYFFQVAGISSTGGTASLQATEEADDFTLDDVHLLDLRVEKEIGFNNFNFTVGVELFNAFNENTALQRRHLLGSSNSNHITEVISPRVWRFGVRFRFD